MKLFKKVLAVVLVGAMAVSMLTACGGSKSSKVKDALKDFDIKMDSVMVQDTEKMMGGLQQLTEKVTSGTVKLNDETQMKKISEKFGEMTDYTFSSSTGKGDYDLYIWTNGADGPSGQRRQDRALSVPDEGSECTCEREKSAAPSGQGIHPEGRVQRQQRGFGYSEKPAEGC